MLISICFTIGPIEQNVQHTGRKGVYELIIIEQITRSFEKFEAEAEKYGSITTGKGAVEVEKLVSLDPYTRVLILFYFSFGNHAWIVRQYTVLT